MMLPFETINFFLLWIFALLNLLLTIVLLRRYDQLLLLPSMLTAFEEKLTSGAPAPAFQAETIDGEFVTLADY